MLRQSVAVILFSVTCIRAGVTFDKAVILDQSDLPGLIKKAPFSCPSGCKVYTPTVATSLKITDDKGDDVIVFSDLHAQAVNKPLELQSGNYFIAFVNQGYPPAFILYVVQKGADNYNSKVYTSPAQVDATNERYVTLLTDLPGFRVSGIGGELGNVKVYATGFDSVSNCKPIFVSRSPENAQRTSIAISGPIGTVDFGTDKGTHIATYGYDYLTKPSTELGSSTVLVSPGYVGCPNKQIFTNVLINEVAQAPYKISSDKGVSLGLAADYAIVPGSPSVDIAINDESIKLSGTNTLTRAFDGPSFNVSVNWKRDANDYLTLFAIQIDNLAKSASSIGLLSYISVTLFTLWRLI